MRRTGWFLAVIMLLYPVDSAHSWWLLRQHRLVELQPPTSGMQFDLGRMVIHCGPVGWAGAWACLLGLLWLSVALGLCFAHYRKGEGFEPATRNVLLGVLASLSIVFGVAVIEDRMAAWVVTDRGMHNNEMQLTRSASGTAAAALAADLGALRTLRRTKINARHPLPAC
jgi:hypothetical protein